MKKILFGLQAVGSVALFLKCVSLEIKPGTGRLPGNIAVQISKPNSHTNGNLGVFNHINQIKQNK
ncbi:MAG: hypothetical protein JWR61_1559 [Ferruginibacter sp.]|nr:hypothetical protein [Ferruginibacter sp.]